MRQHQDDDLLDQREHDDRDHGSEAEAEARPVDQSEEEATTDAADDEPDDCADGVLAVGEPSSERRGSREDDDAADHCEQRRDVSEQVAERLAVALPAPRRLPVVSGRETERVDDCRERRVDDEHHGENDRRGAVENGTDHDITPFLPLWGVSFGCCPGGSRAARQITFLIIWRATLERVMKIFL